MPEPLKLLQVKIPAGLARRLKIHAAKHEITLKAFVIDAVLKQLKT